MFLVSSLSFVTLCAFVCDLVCLFSFILKVLFLGVLFAFVLPVFVLLPPLLITLMS